MEPRERLVEVNNVSTPWDARDADAIGGTILAQSWLFLNKEMVPYEFSYSCASDAAQVEQLSQDTALASLSGFLAEIYAKLSVLGMEKTLGLRRHPGPNFEGFVEVTAGRANINFHPSKASDFII